MPELFLTNYSEVSSDHVIAKLLIGFSNDRKITESINDLTDIIAFGGSQEFKNEREKVREEYSVKVIFFGEQMVRDKTTFTKIDLAIPIMNYGLNEGIPYLLAVLYFASIYEFIHEFQLLDIELPEKYLKNFSGPHYGINLFNDNKKLAIGLILKPRHILNFNIVNELVYGLLCEGIDYLIDDELTVNPLEWEFKERVESVMNLIKCAEKESGKKIFYFTNVTSNRKRTLELAQLSKNEGCSGIMVNSITMGYDIIMELKEDSKINLPIIANVIGRSMVSGGPNYCCNEHIISLLSRICGADAVNIGPLRGNCKAKEEQASFFAKALTSRLDKSENIKKSYAVMSGGVNIRNLFDNWRLYKSPLMIQMGNSLNSLLDAGIKASDIMRTINELKYIYENHLTDSEINKHIIEKCSHDKKFHKTLNQLGWN